MTKQQANNAAINYHIKRNGDGRYCVMFGACVMATRSKRSDAQAWIELQEGKIDSILTTYKSGGNGR